jgi:hypothetical protein
VFVFFLFLLAGTVPVSLLPFLLFLLAFFLLGFLVVFLLLFLFLLCFLWLFRFLVHDFGGGLRLVVGFRGDGEILFAVLIELLLDYLQSDFQGFYFGSQP